MLHVEKICFSYGRTRILEDIGFDAGKGELCGLFGPNGCGKSTLFKCCMKFLKIEKGKIFMDGRDVREMSVKETAGLVSYVPQEHRPPFPFLAGEVVLMGRTPHMRGFFGIDRLHRRKAAEALELLEIGHLADLPYNRLSGGQRQMVLIARAIAQDTKMIFLDEPTSALDYSNQIRIWKIMRRIVERGITILACSHDPNHVAWFCDKAVVMNERGIVAEGTPAAVLTQDLLDEIYADMCSVRNMGGMRVVLPSGLEEERGVTGSSAACA